MLVLSRKIDESLIIGDEVTVTVLSIKGKQVRLGITAPDAVSVHREEVYKMIQNGGKVDDKPALTEVTATEFKQ